MPIKQLVDPILAGTPRFEKQDARLALALASHSLLGNKSHAKVCDTSKNINCYEHSLLGVAITSCKQIGGLLAEFGQIGGYKTWQMGQFTVAMAL